MFQISLCTVKYCTVVVKLYCTKTIIYLSPPDGSPTDLHVLPLSFCFDTDALIFQTTE